MTTEGVRAMSETAGRRRCPVCGSVDVTQGHLEHCQQVDKARSDAVTHGVQYEVPAVATADLWAHVGGYPVDATRLVRLVLDLGWRPVVGADPKRLWSRDPS